MKLSATLISTPLGLLKAVADKHSLYQLVFADSVACQDDCCDHIIEGRTRITDVLERELEAYFSGAITSFTVPLVFLGTPFQNRVWNSLQKIPYGTTWSYTQLAQAVGNPKACRAVAQANGANQFVIIIPCHRVINKNGAFGGYGAGIERKKWLLSCEMNFSIGFK